MVTLHTEFSIPEGTIHTLALLRRRIVNSIVRTLFTVPIRAIVEGIVRARSTSRAVKIRITQRAEHTVF